MSEKSINLEPTINLRVSSELKNQIITEAKFFKQTVSQYLRNHLTEFMNGDLYKKEISFYKNQKFINSTEFLQLIVWMYQKKGNEKCASTEKQLSTYISTLKLIDKNLPSYLVEEFDKVLEDIIRVKNEDSEYNKIFRFCDTSYFNNGFDYTKLENYLLSEVTTTIKASVPKTTTFK